MRPLFRPAPGGLVNVRLGVILATASCIGAVVGTLTYLTYHSLPQALLAAGTATGSFTGLLKEIIRIGPERPTSTQEDEQHNDRDRSV